MRKFFTFFTDRISAFDHPANSLTFQPLRWSSKHIGGCDTAEIAVTGSVDSLPDALRLVGDRVKIYNELGTAVFTGHVNEVEISVGGTTINVSMESVANRIAVVYTEVRADGSDERKTTGWVEDAESIIKFGVKELRPTFEGTTEAAEEFRDQELLRLAWPVPVERSEERDTGGTIHCLGPWHRLGWQYYENLAGLEEYTDNSTGEQYVGASYTAATISFAATDDILDSANGLGSLQEGDSIIISGAVAGANNAEYTVGVEGAGAIEVLENTIVTGAVGPSITLSLGGSRVDRIAQSFTLSEDTPDWSVATIAVRVKRVGSPSGILTMQLCSDSGGSPGAVLESVSLLGSTLSDEMAWTEFELTNTTEIAFGTTYWIVLLKPTPTISAYYIVEVNEEATYAGGQVKVHNGTSWAVRNPAADMPFRVTGKVGTMGQVRDMVEANGEFGVGGLDVIDISGIQTWQYRDGDSKVLDEVESLIAIGRSTDEGLQADVLESRHVIICKSPAATDVPYVYGRDGRIHPQAGGPMEPGLTIAGVWLNVSDVLPTLDIFKPATALFVASSEYDALGDRLNFETDGAGTVWRGRRISTG